VAHALAEQCLRDGTSPALQTGTSLQGVEVNEEMVWAVGQYLSACRGLKQEASWFDIEQYVDLSDLWSDEGETIPEPMFGTADFMAYHDDSKTLYIVDFKYGAGVLVKVDGNSQGQYYALGAYLAMRHKLDIENICIVIVQPRLADEDGVTRRSWTLTTDELMDWAKNTLKPAVEKIDRGEVEYVAGTHCRFCRIAGECEKLYDFTLQSAKDEFDDLDTSLLTNAQLAEVLAKKELLEIGLKAISEEAQFRMETNGETVPDWQLKPRWSNRKWKDENAAADALKLLGLSVDKIYKVVLHSPSEIERLLKIGGAPNARQLISPHTERHVTGQKLAPELAGSAGDEFDDGLDGDDQPDGGRDTPPVDRDLQK